MVQYLHQVHRQLLLSLVVELTFRRPGNPTLLHTELLFRSPQATIQQHFKEETSPSYSHDQLFVLVVASDRPRRQHDPVGGSEAVRHQILPPTSSGPISNSTEPTAPIQGVMLKYVSAYIHMWKVVSRFCVRRWQISYRWAQLT